MFCEGCGAQVQAGQAFCGKCGKSLVGPVQPANRIEQHLHLLGIFWIIYSILHGFGGVALLIFVNTFLHSMRHIEIGAPPVFQNFLSSFQPFFVLIGMLLLIQGIAGVAAGYGLLQRAPWARITAVVLAILAVLNLPFGTAIGIYTFWVLLSPGADIQYEKLSRPVSA